MQFALFLALFALSVLLWTHNAKRNPYTTEPISFKRVKEEHSHELERTDDGSASKIIGGIKISLSLFNRIN